MNKTPDSPTPAETFVLAGKTEEGTWQIVETASVQDDETVEDVKTFLQTMAHANSRNFVETEIMSEADFAARKGQTRIAA